MRWHGRRWTNARAKTSGSITAMGIKDQGASNPELEGKMTSIPDRVARAGVAVHGSSSQVQYVNVVF
jgi:hypothetical protein